ncbi:Bro-N domain-containing protein [Sphingobium yanoikuyae]|uniref:BRO-N domain-containing protein n=1 Tax=Sphingobium yanoikuyae TaxID=13690 RepID=UPI003B8EAF5D
MNNALISYQFDETPVRVVMIAGNPWFVASDLATALGYPEASKLTRMLDDDERGLHIVETLGGHQDVLIVSESGMYASILRSRRKEAKRFRKWVTAEVLPELRRTGRYIMHDVPPEVPALVSPDIDPPRVMAAVALTNAARRLYGIETARKVWRDCGLPIAISEAGPSDEGDPLATPVKAWCAGKSGFSIVECAEGIGIAEPDEAMRRRLGRILRFFGYHRHTARRGDQIVNLFVCGEA